MAEQLEFFPVPSPCRGICRTDNKGYCVGCFRSREERFQWMSFSDTQKRNILRLCQQRRLRRRRVSNEDGQDNDQQHSLF
ncbi:DUF1289 domain-containing protein [Tatumella saanichensis]|uniref:DUF1289 domain-containing protein n=1 Tax=Tatumella saanichensis TaxID=480813 RepID=UPI0004A37A82|nr:DUF1289 domain-containing protein [Tatumella saanichensis]